MAKVADVNIAVAARPHEELSEQVSPRMMVGSVLGPLAGLALWFAPIQLEPVAHQTLAIVAFMIVYWITEPIDHGITAMIGCFLFWALHIAEFRPPFPVSAKARRGFYLAPFRWGKVLCSRVLPGGSVFLLCVILAIHYSAWYCTLSVFVSF